MGLNGSFSLKGKTALVTGSSRGIGRAILLGLAEAGADVVVHASHEGDRLHATADEAKALGVKACAVAGDLGDSGAVRKVYDASAAFSGKGGIDILVLNASIQTKRQWNAFTAEDFAQHMNVNVRASLELIQLSAPYMQKTKWGRILTIGSVQQSRPHPEMLIYAASKSAQLSMVKSLAKQLAPGGITVNNLAPGVIATDRNTEALSNKDYHDLVLSKIPAGFFGEAADCAGAALLLCSDAGRYITGADVYADGGMSL